MDYVLPIPCPKCGLPAGTVGYAEWSGPQLIGRCPSGHYVKCVPKTESGLKPRSLQTTHQAIKPKQRMRIVTRANGRCETCGRRTEELQVGHVVSVDDGHANRLTDDEINSDENLCAMCPECNSGLGSETLPLKVFLNILMARLRTGRSNGSQPGGRPGDAA
jgi:hypothetical protein